MNRLDVDALIQKLGLQPHPQEGGYYVETYRSSDEISGEVLGAAYSGSRHISTAIYYLLTPDTFSEMHQLQSDEIFHFYLGDPITMLQLSPDGLGQEITLGSDLDNDQSLQVIVPKGFWQGSFLQEGGQYALLGCTVAPGFDFTDYRQGTKDELIQKYPEHSDLISKLTHR